MAIKINMDGVELDLGLVHAPSSALEELDIELNFTDCNIAIQELVLAESISSHEHSNDDVAYHGCDAPSFLDEEENEEPEDGRTVAQATADDVGETLIYTA